MVDPNLINISKLDVETKRRIVLYVINEKKISPGELGYSSSYIYKVRKGLVAPSDELVRRCLQYLTFDEYAKIVSNDHSNEVTISDAIRILERALRDSQFREILLKLFEKYLNTYLGKSSTIYIVTRDDVEIFRKRLRQEGKTEKTIRDHVRYLEKTLARIDYKLSLENIREVLFELQEESIHVARHATKALKKFIKLVIMERDPQLGQILYNSFKVIRPKTQRTPKLDFKIEDLRKVWQELPSLESKLYFTLLVECGLRPGEPFIVKLSNIDWNLRVVWFETEEESTKRRYITFLHEETARWIREVYLPYRDKFVKQYLSSLRNLGYSTTIIEEWKNKLIPFDRSRLRREIKETFRKVLGKEIELYDLRKFWSTWMTLRGVPGQIIDILQGRTPPKEFEVLMRHYVTIGSGSFILELRKWFDNNAPKIIPTQSSPGPF